MPSLVVIAALLVAAWILFSMGFRIQRRPAAALTIATLVGIAVLAQLILPAPAYAVIQIGAYLTFCGLVFRETPWVARRNLRPSDLAYVDAMLLSDAMVRHEYNSPPALLPDGLVDVAGNRVRLEAALTNLRELDPPTPTLRRLTRERIALHKLYIEVILSATPISSEVDADLRRDTGRWLEDLERLSGRSITRSDALT